MEQNHLIQKIYMPRKILKMAYNTLLASLTLFVTLQFTACSNPPEPVTTGEKFPFGVFPLNDVKWVYSQSVFVVEEPESEYIYDSEGKHIATISYQNCIDNISYSVRQVTENKAELYKTRTRNWERLKIDKITQALTWIEDTVFIIENSALFGEISLKNKKVYYGSKILYDFGLNIGDIFTIISIHNNYNFSIASIDSVKLGNEYRKRYNYNFLSASNPINYPIDNSFSIIEGIGIEYFDFFFTLSDPFREQDPVPPSLTSIYYKEQLIWEEK